MDLTEFTKLQAKWLNETMGDRHLKDGYYCPKCRSKGFLYTVRNDEIISYRCSCLDMRKTLYVIKESGLEKAIESKTFDNFQANENWQKNLKDSALAFLENDTHKTFFIGGQCGSGKTHLCTAMCNDYMKKGKPTLYFLWTTETRKLKSYANDPSYGELIAPFKEVEVLYIDDFFKVMTGASPSSADVNIAFDILNYRLQDPSKITVISSEFTIEELLKIDEGTSSRICEKAGPFVKCIDKDPKKNQRLKH